MLVVADSSPLLYLVLIEQAGLLPALFGEIVIPDEVARELAHDNAPQRIREFLAARPAWLSVRTPRSLTPIPGIDPGEQAAISLAEELGADLLLIDDLDGRRAAQRRGIPVTGTLGVLDRAADRGLVDIRRALDDLQTTTMHLSQSLVQSLVKRYTSVDDGGQT
jgi:predicted nucleic acid-binding protein